MTSRSLILLLALGLGGCKHNPVISPPTGLRIKPLKNIVVRIDREGDKFNLYDREGNHYVTKDFKEFYGVKP